MNALRENADEPMSVRDLAEATNDKVAVIRNHANQMAKDGKLVKLSSISDGNGSTGSRYRIKSDESQSFGGLSV